MFPFNQAYKPRPKSPVPPFLSRSDSYQDLPVSPVSFKPPRKPRKKISHPAPYPPPSIVTPSPQSSEIEYETIEDHGVEPMVEQEVPEPVNGSPVDVHVKVPSPYFEEVPCANPMELTTKRPETPTPPPPEPLKWGDLVVVDYAERKKVYKWPAIIVPPGHMTDNMLDFPPEGDDTAIGVRWIEPYPSYSWVPESTVSRMMPGMIDEMLSTIKGPKKLIQAWEMARTPPSVFEYLLEKKASYHQLVQKLKSY